MKQIKGFVQSILGNAIIRRVLVAFNKANATIFSSTYLLSVPYHWLAFLNFMREQRAVLYGKKKYYRNIDGKYRKTRVELRRNIHRLEKGLIMQPQREVFAQNYIVETVESYENATNQVKEADSQTDTDEVAWAHNVLTDFFAKTKTTGNIAKAKEHFDKIDFAPDDLAKKPYVRKNTEKMPTYDELLNLSMYRRSVRWFEQKAVPREVIDKALLVARQSPTACNRLPYEFKIFDDPELVEKVANTPFGTGGYADSIPTIAVLVGKLDSYFSARDRHAIYVDSSLAAMSFVLALEAQGVASCMINWPDFEPLEMKMQKLLGLEFSDRVIMLIAIGYPDKNGKVPYSQKKSLDTIRTYNFEAPDEE